MLAPAQNEPITSTKIGAHIPSLDGVRGIAILMVIIHHFAMRRDIGTGVTKILFRFCEVGWSGVDLFFVLSGFLITGILLQAKNQSSPIKTFYARRTLRIFPLYYLSLIAIIFVWPAVSASPEKFAAIQQNQAWYWTYMANVLIVTKLPLGEVNAAHFWSLAVEEQFYMFWPFIVLFVSTENLRRVCCWMIAGALAFRTTCFLLQWGHSPAYVLTISRIDALAAGALVATILQDPTLRDRLARILPKLAAGFFAVFFVIVVIQGSFRRGPLMLTLGFTALAGLYATLVATAALQNQALLRKFLESGWLRFFGKYSYAMYVFHPFIMDWMHTWYPTAAAKSSLLASPLPGFVAYSVITLGLTSVAALLSWNLFERWFLMLKVLFEPKPRPTA